MMDLVADGFWVFLTCHGYPPRCILQCFILFVFFVTIYAVIIIIFFIKKRIKSKGGSCGACGG
jgi:hypothetical protein